MSSPTLSNKTHTPEAPTLQEFQLPKVGFPRSAFIGRDTDAQILAKAVKQGIDIPGEIPVNLKKDRHVQEAALNKFQEAINAAKDQYFHSRVHNILEATDEKVQGLAKEAAPQMAKQFDLTKHSPKDTIAIITGSLSDSLQRMRPANALKTVGFVLEVAKELGIEKEVLKNPTLQRSVLSSMKWSLDETISIHSVADTYVEGVKQTTQIAKLFQIQTYNKESLFDTLETCLNSYRQLRYHNSHQQIYAAFRSMTEDLEVASEFVGRKNVQNFGLYSVKEKLKTLSGLDGKHQRDTLTKDLLDIVEKLELTPARSKELAVLLASAAQSAKQVLNSHSLAELNQHFEALASIWKVTKR